MEKEDKVRPTAAVLPLRPTEINSHKDKSEMCDEQEDCQDLETAVTIDTGDWSSILSELEETGPVGNDIYYASSDDIYQTKEIQDNNLCSQNTESLNSLGRRRANSLPTTPSSHVQSYEAGIESDVVLMNRKSLGNMQAGDLISLNSYNYGGTVPVENPLDYSDIDSSQQPTVIHHNTTRELEQQLEDDGDVSDSFSTHSSTYYDIPSSSASTASEEAAHTLIPPVRNKNSSDAMEHEDWNPAQRYPRSLRAADQASLISETDTTVSIENPGDYDTASGMHQPGRKQNISNGLNVMQQSSSKPIRKELSEQPSTITAEENTDERSSIESHVYEEVANRSCDVHAKAKESTSLLQQQHNAYGVYATPRRRQAEVEKSNTSDSVIIPIWDDEEDDKYHKLLLTEYKKKRAEACRNHACMIAVGLVFIFASALCFGLYFGLKSPAKQTIDVCVCYNGGECVVDVERNNSTICNCTGTGYEGERCDEKIFDPCDNYTCYNNGQCYTIDNVAHCNCNYTGFVGIHCQESPCESEPCANGGVCIETGKIASNYICDCSSTEFYGVKCTRKRHPCIFNKSPCQHGGVCMPDKLMGYTCDCTDTGYTGQNCSQEDLCNSSPCLNNGRCQANSSDSKGYTCSCSGTGYMGLKCETFDPCGSFPCSNGGTCKPLPDPLYRSDYTCMCDADRYTGQHCQIRIPKPCDSTPCFHNGECTNVGDDFYCKCKPNYTGKTCDESVVAHHIDPPLHVLPQIASASHVDESGKRIYGYDKTDVILCVALSSLCVGILVLCVGLCVICRKYKAKEY